MKITVEKIDNVNIIISGTVDNSLIEKKVSLLKEQATQDTLETTDTDAFQRDAEGQALQDFIESGMKEANIAQDEILGQPSFRKYEKQEHGLDIEVEISISPVIDTNVEYMDIVPSYTKPTVDAEAVDATLAKVAVQQAPFTQIVAPRAVKSGDLVVIDFEGFLNGRALQGANEQGYKLKMGSKTLMPGFEEQVIGMKPNEEKVIKVTFPKNYQAEALAGKETEFNVTLQEIHEQVALEINDALAKKTLNDENATLDTLKVMLTEQVSSQAFSNLYTSTLKPQIIQGLLTKFDFTLPNNVVEQEIDGKVNERAQNMSKEELVLYQESKEKFKALRESMRAEASDSIKAALIVDALAKKEGIDVSEEEVLSALTNQAQISGQKPDELIAYYKTNNLMTAVKVGLIEDKLFSRMLGLDKR